MLTSKRGFTESFYSPFEGHEKRSRYRSSSCVFIHTLGPSYSTEMVEFTTNHIFGKELRERIADVTKSRLEGICLTTVDGAVLSDQEKVLPHTQVFLQRHVSPHLFFSEQNHGTVPSSRSCFDWTAANAEVSIPQFERVGAEVSSKDTHFNGEVRSADLLPRPNAIMVEHYSPNANFESGVNLMLPSDKTNGGSGDDAGYSPSVWKDRSISPTCSNTDTGNTNTLSEPSTEDDCFSFAQGSDLGSVQTEFEGAEEERGAECCSDSEAGIVHVVVRALSGQRYRLTFSAEELGLEVKAAIGELEGVTHDCVLLLFKSHRLSDFETLRDCGITDGATLSVVPLYL